MLRRVLFAAMQISNTYNRISGKRSIHIIAVLVFLATATAYLLPPIRQGELDYPPEPGDGPDYDVIAFQLARGRGFSYDWDNAEYRAPYAAQPDRYKYLFGRSGTFPTAYRPPLVPAVMAASYFLFGRNFAVIRALNCLAMAFACNITFTIVARRLGVIPGLLFAVLLVLDGRLGFYARLILTESIACLLVALLVWSLLQLLARKQNAWAVLAGIFSGAAILSRTIFALWLPVISILVYILTRRRTTKLLDWNATRLAGIFLGVSIAVSMPWMIRNVLLLRSFSPLGTQGDVTLSAAYSDAAVQNRGIWFDLESTGFFDKIVSGKTGLEREKATAIYSKATAVEWIKNNPTMVPVLMIFKTYDLWKLRAPLDSLIFFLVLVGMLLYPNRTELTVYLGLLIANTLTIALTYSTGDSRFLVPVLPILFALASVGLWTLIQCIIQRINPHECKKAGFTSKAT